LPVAGLALAALVMGKAMRPMIAEAIDPQQAAVAGVVFEDRNGNDRQDPGERGVQGVSVSDGVKTAITGSDGRYALDVDVARRITDLVFITKPAGYALPTDQYMTPRFYRDLGQLQDGAGTTADFALLPDERGRRDNFTFANVADPHVNGDLPNQMRAITSTSKDVAFVQVSGDLTNNATDAEFTTYRNGTRPRSFRSGPPSATTSTSTAARPPTPRGSTTTAATWGPSGTRSTTASATSWCSRTTAPRRSRSSAPGSSRTSLRIRRASASSCSCTSR
jgi:hypothetical protein